MKKEMTNFAKTMIATLLLVCGCAGGNDKKSGTLASTSQAGGDANTIAAIVGDLQACSYDGETISINPSSFTSNSDAIDVVGNIMRFTGLPQNFEVMEAADVPNACAVILQGQDGLPKRVIAYSGKFMREVSAATQNNNWAPISIMAHEIAHHLCGHTIMPGGSQPPTELEADKFSGYVLYKMGASLDDAQKAINTLVPDSESPTHPARSRRVVAIEDGWKQACEQQSKDCGGNATVVMTNPPVNDGTSTVTIPVVDQPLPSIDVPETVPQFGDDKTPSKFDRFVMDEVGVLEKADKDKINKFLFEKAKEQNVECIVIITDNLQGKSADDYAFAAMRNLRVGKLEMGNGAVLVVSPKNNSVGVALMSGLRFEIDDDRINNEVRTNLNHALEYIGKKDKQWTANFIDDACARIYSLAGVCGEWVIRYRNLADMQAANDKEAGNLQDVSKSLVFKKMVRITGTITNLNGSANNKYNNEYALPAGGKKIEMKTDDGKYVILFVTKNMESIMPSKLEMGKKYAFVCRENAIDFLAFDLVSYDMLSK